MFLVPELEGSLSSAIADLVNVKGLDTTANMYCCFRRTIGGDETVTGNVLASAIAQMP